MSKTNHQRNFKGTKDSERYSGSPMGGTGKTSILADVRVGAGWGGDNANGHRGHAEARRGAKKFVNSRIRFHENAKTQQLADTAASE